LKNAIIDSKGDKKNLAHIIIIPALESVQNTDVSLENLEIENLFLYRSDKLNQVSGLWIDSYST